ncbi:MAG: HAMP domain-containing protein [Phyllobacteriaceae bacterium]|nr:HAMP domain-containing protein [Phyllobacteriaceae bacterium]
MKSRLGIAWRLALIVVAALVAIQIAVIGAYMVERRDVARFALGPQLPDQIAALVHLADDRSEAERRLIAGAAAGPGVRIRFPEAADDVVSGGREVVFLETLVRRALGGDARPIRVEVDRGLGALGAIGGRGTHVRVVVALHGGGVLDFAAGGELTARLLGLPVGLIAGLFGMTVALIAVLAVAREAKPLVRLAQAVDGFGHDLAPRPLDETGAPEVRRLVRAINRMQTRIVSLVETRTVMLAAIAHDLGTTMTRLRLRLELSSPDPMRDRAVKDLDDMARLVDDGLAFARSTSEADREPLDLAELVGDAVADRIELGEAIVLRPLPAAAPIVASHLGLSRVIGNLVDNALRYAGDAEVALVRVAAEWELTVADHGSGISPEDRARIFEPYVRLEASRNRATGGTGLGLAIARQIVAAHGGTIEVRDRADGRSGAVFAVRLPAA